MATNRYDNATRFLRDLLIVAGNHPSADPIQQVEYCRARIARPEGDAVVEGLYLIDGGGQPLFLTLEGAEGVRIDIGGYEDFTLLDEEEEEDLEAEQQK
jgi:hypothetical protein